MKFVFCIIVVLFLVKTNAQKIVEKTISGQNITSIIINGDEIFNIKLIAQDVDDIKIKTKIEGEYSEDIVLLANVKIDSLIISSAYNPLYTNHNDKLSAHKVISIETELIVPRNLNVYLNSNIASVEILGKFNRLIIELYQGSCNLKSFRGDAIINTIDGQIILNTNFAIIEAKTKTGLINKELITKGNDEIRLNSVNGNISITKTKK